MGKTERDEADTVLVRKDENPEIFEISVGASQLNETQKKRLYAYYKKMCEMKKK